MQVTVRVAVLVVHEPSRFDVLGFVVQYGVVLFLHVGLQPSVPRLLQKLLYDEPTGQLPLSG
jgi:hypothetical protein